MKHKSLVSFLLIMVIIVLILPGCSSEPKISEDGYIELTAFNGSSDMESEQFVVTTSDNRMNIKTTDNNKDGIKGQIVNSNGTVASAFSVGDTASEQVLPLKIKPGEYTIKVESTGTKFDISFEEKYTEQ